MTWFGGNYSWWQFLTDARHTPAVLALGKMWSWSLAVPYVQIPLGIITALWLIQVLNVTWSGIWANVFGVPGGAAHWIFTIVDDFFDHSVYFRIAFLAVGFYLLLVCVGAISLTTCRWLLWCVNRLCNAWSFKPPVPLIPPPFSMF